MKAAFVRTLQSLAAQSTRLMLLTGDLGFNALEPFVADYPKQFLNVGVAEQNMMGVATGLALSDRIVFTYSIANFPIFRCLEQIRNDVCYHEANVKIAAVGGGLSYGALGMSHHATEDMAAMSALPGIPIVAPGDDWEVAEATKAIAAWPGPAYLRLDKSAQPALPALDGTFQLGRARRMSAGSDFTIAATGGMVAESLRAAERLATEGIHCQVLSVHTVRPLDTEAILGAARNTGGLITAEEHSIHAGLGGAVAELLAESGEGPYRFRRLGLRSGFSSVVGSQRYLRKLYGLDAEAIADCVRDCLRRPLSKPHQARTAKANVTV